MHTPHDAINSSIRSPPVDEHDDPQVCVDSFLSGLLLRWRMWNRMRCQSGANDGITGQTLPSIGHSAATAPVPGGPSPDPDGWVAHEGPREVMIRLLRRTANS